KTNSTTATPAMTMVPVPIWPRKMGIFIKLNLRSGLWVMRDLIQSFHVILRADHANDTHGFAGANRGSRFSAGRSRVSRTALHICDFPYAIGGNGRDDRSGLA